MTSLPPLPVVLDALEAEHGTRRVPPTVDPFELVVWENVAYLVPDARRRAVFARLQAEVGLQPADLLAAGHDAIVAAIEDGGMHPGRRAGKLLEAARIARDVGDLNAIARGPLAAARKTLRRFPGIGPPGADKILLFSGAHPVFALESNGLRTLLRLGYAPEGKSYAASYRAVLAALEGQLPSDADGLIRAHLLLRRHGETLCRRTRPDCAACPVERDCGFAPGQAS